LELEAGIIEQNYGSYHHVQGRHYRNLDDAARERRRLAEMYLREEIRLEGICAWCDRPFDEDEQKTPAAGRFIHTGKCTDEFNALCTSVGGRTLDLAPDELRAFDAWSNSPTDSDIESSLGRTFEASAREAR